jgi:hypothetical protein
MPPTSNFFNRWGGKRLNQLLALLLAFAISTPVLFADDNWDHERDRNHGPDLIGVWTQTYADSDHFLALVTFHKDGTASFDQQGDVAFDPVQSHAHGLWKQIDNRTFIATFKGLEYSHNASFPSLYGTATLLYRYKLYPSGDQYDSTLFVRETLANGQVNAFPGHDAHGVRLLLEEPPQ